MEILIDRKKPEDSAWLSYVGFKKKKKKRKNERKTFKPNFSKGHLRANLKDQTKYSFRLAWKFWMESFTLIKILDLLYCVGKKWKAAGWAKLTAGSILDWEIIPSHEYSQALVNIINLFNDTIAFLDTMISEPICNIN